MAARWMDDPIGGWNAVEDPPRLGRRAARRARAARVEDMTEEDEEFVDALDAAFASTSEPAAARHEPAAARHEPAAASLDRRNSVARAAAHLDRERLMYQQAPHARSANSELQRLHRIARPEQTRAREPERWAVSYMEQLAECGICLRKKPLKKFVLTPCGHGCCRTCVKQMQEDKCPFCRSDVDRYCRARDWPRAAELERLLDTQAAMNPYTI
jgi:hypothetical protein